MQPTPLSTEPSTTTSSGEYEIAIVPTEDSAEAWPHVESLIAAALPRACGRLTLSSCWAGVAQGKFTLWILGKQGRIYSVALSEVLAFPEKKVLSVFLYAGDRRRVQHLWPIVEEVAKALECAEIQIAGSRAWARVAPQFARGFKEAFTVYTKEVG